MNAGEASLSVTIRRMASGQGPSWLLIITRGSRWWARVRPCARCVGRNPWEWPSNAASGHQGSGHHHQWESVRRIPRRRPGRPHGSVRRAQPASDIQVPSHEFQAFAKPTPSGSFYVLCSADPIAPRVPARLSNRAANPSKTQISTNPVAPRAPAKSRIALPNRSVRTRTPPCV